MALPYFPDGKPLSTLGEPTPTDAQRPGQQAPRPGRTGTERNAPLPGSEGRPDSNTITDVGDTSALPDGTGGQPTTPVAGNPPVATSSPVAAVPPSITTVSSSAEPAVDPTAIMNRTRSFFTEVTSNVQAAANLTAGTLHDDAVALIKQKYGDVATIAIQSISLDPTSGLTVSVLRVVNSDGTAQTQRTTLHFTLTGDPKITNPGG
jgi:hypothetical protein